MVWNCLIPPCFREGTADSRAWGGAELTVREQEAADKGESFRAGGWCPNLIYQVDLKKCLLTGQCSCSHLTSSLGKSSCWVI